jgi:hypothetical protein
MKKIFLLPVAVLCLVACQDDDATPNNTPVDIAFESLVQNEFGSYENQPQPQNFIINSQGEWNAFADTYTYPPQGISVDYGQKTVISCVGELRPDMGASDSFEITSVIQQNDTVHVNVHVVYGLDEQVMHVFYQPYHVVSIPKTTLPFKFTYTGPQ